MSQGGNGDFDTGQWSTSVVVASIAVSLLSTPHSLASQLLILLHSTVCTPAIEAKQRQKKKKERRRLDVVVKSAQRERELFSWAMVTA